MKEKTVEVVKGDSAGAVFGTNCGADRARASRDPTSAGSTAHRGVRTPVTAPVEHETLEVSERSAALFQTKADSDELKSGCMNSGSTHADRAAACD